MAQEPDDRPLFGNLVISDPVKPHRSRAMPYSLAAHILVVGLLGAFALFGPGDEMPHTDPIAVLLYDPPPPPPPPPLRGSPMVQKQKENKPTTPEKKPDPDKLTVPDEHPKETELKPENKMPESEQKGVADGSDQGSEEGMEGGVEGGEVGGVFGGTLGGVIGGTGLYALDQQPRVLRQAKPVYPPDAFTKKIEGTVEVEFIIELSGRVEHARVVGRPSILDGAALQAVRQWVFVPAIKGGKPVRTQHVAPVRFRIY